MSSTRSSSSSSATIDDDLSLMVHDSSETTVATQTSRSWHSVRSDLPLNSHLFIRSPMINHWLARCSIEPDVRLTTAQEWKLRTCLRRFLQLCNRPLRLIWVRTEGKCFHLDSSDTGFPTNARERIPGIWAISKYILPSVVVDRRASDRARCEFENESDEHSAEQTDSIRFSRSFESAENQFENGRIAGRVVSADPRERTDSRNVLQMERNRAELVRSPNVYDRNR